MHKTPWFVVVLLLLLSVPVSASEIFVAAGGNLQAALNAAQPGDEIVLQFGAIFTGNFVLPVKAEGPVIVIRSSSALPFRRITPADSSLLPLIVSPTVDPALSAVGGVKNWKLDGIWFGSTQDGQYNVIFLQGAENISFDRLLILGGPLGQRRAIMGNGRNISLTRSHIANIWRNGEESQGFCAWDGAGPYLIEDNFIEAASQAVMFGGAGSSAVADIPADILVQKNTFSKPESWRNTGKVVKNLFELKAAKRVKVLNNTMIGNWTDAQNGYAVLFTVRNDNGDAPWSVVEDVEFAYNTVTSERGVNVLGYDSYKPSGRATRINIHDNTFNLEGRLLQVGGEVGELGWINNTANTPESDAMFYGGMVWPNTLAAVRSAVFAVEKLIIYGGTPVRFLADMEQAAGRSTPEMLDIFVGDLVTSGTPTQPPPPQNPPASTDPIVTALAAELAATKLALQNTQASVATLSATVSTLQSTVQSTQGALATLNIKVADQALYLAATPMSKNIQQLINYLRLIPR
jgi:hypothetical protein